MLKKILYKIPGLYNFAILLRSIPTKDILCKRLSIKSCGGGYVRLCKYIVGSGNNLEIGRNCHLLKTSIHIVGNNNRIVFGNNCRVGNNCSFWMEGNNITIQVGQGTTFTHSVHFCAQEDNTTIHVGMDCMFSNTITVRTSDSHPIYDTSSGERINPARDVIIGNHVWIAPGAKVMKGAKIGDNSIIGSNTMVTNEIPCNCLAVGAPSKVVKTKVNWTREKIF